jgi:hypothetical protein
MNLLRTLAKLLGTLLVEVGVVTLVVGLLLWWEGSTIGVALACLCGMWGFDLIAWGALVRWPGPGGCLGCAAAAAASLAFVLVWVRYDGGWETEAILCAIPSGLAMLTGLALTRYHWRSNGPTES